MQNCAVFEEKIKVLCTLIKNFDFSKISTIRIGPICKWYAVVHSTSNLIRVLKLCKEHHVSFFVVGGASNILFCGKYFNGLVLRIGMNKISCQGTTLSVYAGAKLGCVVNYCAKHGLSGFENLVSIPATIGGAVAMNAGAFGAQIADVLKSVDVLNLTNFSVERFSVLEYFPKHHQSVFTNNFNYVIIKADFHLTLKSVFEIKKTVVSNILKRANTQKVCFPNLGSIFKRAEFKFPPAYYVEKCGLKSFCQGEAMVSTIHAGFIVNKQNATSADVCSLIQKVQNKVLSDFGVSLEPEIIVIGEENGFV